MFLAPSKSRKRAKIWINVVSKTSNHIQNKIKIPNPSQETLASGFQGHGWSVHLQNQDIEPKFGSCVYQRPVTISKSRSRCQNLNQKPPASSKAPNEDFKDMDVLCTFKIKIESPNSDHGCVKDQWLIQLKIKMLIPSQKHGVRQSPIWGLKEHGCSLHLQNKDRQLKFGRWVYQRPRTISKTRSRYLKCPEKTQMRT